MLEKAIVSTMFKVKGELYMQCSITEEANGMPRKVVLRLARDEVARVAYSFPCWDVLNRRGRGMVRYATPLEFRLTEREMARYKPPLEEHLKILGLVDKEGKPIYRAVVVSNRNLGNNLGYVSYDRLKSPKLFHLWGEPVDRWAYKCFLVGVKGGFEIAWLRFEEERVYRVEGPDGREGEEITDEVDWAISGCPLVEEGRVMDIRKPKLLRYFYDIRHVFFFSLTDPAEEEILYKLYEGFPEDPDSFGRNAARLFGKRSRSFYLHTCLALTETEVLIVQAAGKLEEVGELLVAEGAEEAIILDNAGSCFIYVTLSPERWGFLSVAPGWRPPTISCLAFVLHGSIPSKRSGRAE